MDTFQVKSICPPGSQLYSSKESRVCVLGEEMSGFKMPGSSERAETSEASVGRWNPGKSHLK